MNRELIDDYLFYDFYKNIKKELGSSLDINQYLLFIEALIKGLGKNDDGIYTRNSLFQLCETLWLSKYEFKTKFAEIFDRHFSKIESKFENAFKSQKESEPIDNASPIPDSNTEKDLNQDSGIHLKDEEKPTEEDEVELPPRDDSPVKEKDFREINIAFEQMGDTVSSKNVSFDLAQVNTQTKFIFGNYHPVKERKFKQSLRYSQKYRKRKSPEINFEQTASKYAQKGGLPTLIFKEEPLYSSEILVLIDNGKSMVGFHKLSEYLSSKIQESLSPVEYHKYYVKSFKQGKYFKNETSWNFINIEQLLDRIDRASYVFIISDAGAALGEKDDEQTMVIIQLLEQFKKKTNKILWLNPMPKARWIGNPSFFIPMIIDMIELSEEGISYLPQILKRM